MSAETETIVRALAAKDEPVYDSYICRLCGSFPDEHETDCPWRLARAWVAEHPEPESAPESLRKLHVPFTDETGWQRIEHGFDTTDLIVSMFDPDGRPLFGDMIEIESANAVVVRITRPCVVRVVA